MKLELDINDSILQHKKLTEFDVKMIIGVALHNKVTSTGKTAEILGMDYRDFYENMGEYGGVQFDMDINDFLKELENARK